MTPDTALRLARALNTTPAYWMNMQANYDIDITDVIQTKIRALTHHVSQFGDRGEDFIANVEKRWSSADGRFYEHFERVSLPVF